MRPCSTIRNQTIREELKVVWCCIKQLLAEWIGTVILRVCLMWHCISVSQKVMEEDNVTDGENNSEFSVCILLLLCHYHHHHHHHNQCFIPVKEYEFPCWKICPVSCVWLHMYSRADFASMGVTICHWIKMYTMLTLTNFNLIVQLLVNVFRAQEASQNVILFCDRRNWKMGACEKMWMWLKWSDKRRMLRSERLQENVGCLLQVVCCNRLMWNRPSVCLWCFDKGSYIYDLNTN
jgi:hypothetical protein